MEIYLSFIPMRIPTCVLDIRPNKKKLISSMKKESGTASNLDVMGKWGTHKPMPTWVHEQLDWEKSCHHYEVTHLAWYKAIGDTGDIIWLKCSQCHLFTTQVPNWLKMDRQVTVILEHQPWLHEYYLWHEENMKKNYNISHRIIESL
jgi:hypothetical protein